MSDTNVRTRFAPSPSGFLHIGGARTALFNYLYAKATGGSFVLRVEDTDQERSTPESEKIILDSLEWLGIKADEGPREGGSYGPYRQSERLDVYSKYTEKLIESGQAYPCFCTNEELEEKQNRSKRLGLPHVYDGKCRNLSKEEAEEKKAAGIPYAIRFKIDPEELVVDDIVQEKVKFDTKLIGDFIIVKSDGFPSYNYAVVIDDHDMKITHVIRGVGHLSNTPRQILIHRALDLPLPAYAHISEIVGTDRKKLSKRRGATSVMFFEQAGYLSEALVNYMALLGWYPEDGVEFMPGGELEKQFDVKRCSKSPAMFDFFLTDESTEEFDPLKLSKSELEKFINKKSKLNWINQKYIRNLSDDDLYDICLPYLKADAKLAKMINSDEPRVRKALSSIKEYMVTLDDGGPYIAEIFRDTIGLEDDARDFLQPEEARNTAKKFAEIISEEKPQKPDDYSAAMKKAGKELGVKGKNLFMPIRAASTGQLHGLELPVLFSLLSAETVSKRINDSLKSLD